MVGNVRDRQKGDSPADVIDIPVQFSIIALCVAFEDLLWRAIARM